MAPRHERSGMQLLLIRHAIAEERSDWAATGRPDDDRPLTAEGRRRFRRAARGLVTQVPTVAQLATSPLVRAKQTAQIAASAWGGLRLVETDALRPDVPAARLLTWLRSQTGPCVALVGHEPHLGAFAAACLGAASGERTPFKKGGAMLIAFRGIPRAGAGMLVWALPPKLLRALGR